MTIQAKRAAIQREANEIAGMITKAISTKNYRPLDALERRLKDLEVAKKELARQEAAAKAAGQYGSVVASGGDLGSQPYITAKTMTGAQLSPLAFSEKSLNAMYKAFKARQPFSIQAETKGFSTVDSLLPAQLDPQVLAHIHEWRILDRLPSIAISAPSYEFIVHNYASDTGTLGSAPFAGFVSEGSQKPEYIPATSQSTVTAQKLAMHTAISYETLADFPQWLSYVQTEAFRQVVDAENAALLNGNGTAPNILGFLQTSGILTHNCSTDPGGWTAIDSIEAAITQMRVGAALERVPIRVDFR